MVVSSLGNTAAEGQGPLGVPGVRRVRAVLAMCGMPQDAIEDGLQQVQLKLLEWQADPARDEIRDRGAWASVVAARVAADWHRGTTRDRNLAARLAQRWEGSSLSPHRVDRTLALAVADALDGLNLEQRQVIVLRYYLDLKLSLIATVLEIPEGTVKSRLHHAQKVLREALKDLDKEML